MIKFSISLFFFYIFVHNRSFLDLFPNSNLLQTFGPLFWEFTTGINFPCSKSWLRMMSFTQIYSTGWSYYNNYMLYRELHEYKSKSFVILNVKCCTVIIIISTHAQYFWQIEASSQPRQKIKGGINSRKSRPNKCER